MNRKIIDHLNNKAGTKYRHGTKKADSHINARISEGATMDDFISAIDNMVSRWRGTNQELYIRPETLFGTKFWGYVNSKDTDLTKTDNRRDLLKAVLKAAGLKDISASDITIYDEVMKLIPTDQLPQLAVKIIRSGGEFKRPDTMISEAVKEFERGIIASNMRKGKRISDYDKFVDFLNYAFRGRPICNGIEGIYKPFVTIGMDRDGYLVNQFIWKKLSSSDEADVYQWLYEHQERIGVVDSVSFDDSKKMIEYVEVKSPTNIPEDNTISGKVLAAISSISKAAS